MATRPKAPTMKDVAEQVGVSVQTVSAVVNHKPGITEETQERVLAAIEKLGYRPFSIARSMRTRQTRTIALVVSDIANPSFAIMASAAEDYAHEHGYSLILYNTHDDIVRETGYIRTAVDRWVDGMIFVSAEDKMTSLNALEAAGIPTVSIDRIPDGYNGPSVTLDNIKAGRMAAEYLLDLGHTCIAHISGPLKLRLARERQAGFQQAIEARGLSSGLCVSGEGNWECMAGYKAMQKIMASDRRPTALFAANDRMAIGAIQVIHEAGLWVPDDISVVGLDDIELAAFQNPPLTTVRQSFSELATMAVRILLDILGGKDSERRQIVVEPSLVVRQSAAPLSQGKIITIS